MGAGLSVRAEKPMTMHARRRQAREHDAWFRAEVEQGLREADDPETRRGTTADARAAWRRQRAELAKRPAGQAKVDGNTE